MTTSRRLQPRVGVCSHPFKTRLHCLLHAAENTFLLNRRRNLNTRLSGQRESGMMGQCSPQCLFTWLTSSSKDLSEDLLTDPELSSATHTRAAHRGVYFEGDIFPHPNKHVFYFEGRVATSVFKQQSFCRQTDESSLKRNGRQATRRAPETQT